MYRVEIIEDDVVHTYAKDDTMTPEQAMQSALGERMWAALDADEPLPNVTRVRVEHLGRVVYDVVPASVQ